MAKLRSNQLFNIPQTSVEGLHENLQTKASASFRNFDIYVDAVKGSDEHEGTVDRPKRTIQGAVDSLPVLINHPIEILLAKGIYTETVKFTQHTLGANGFITLKPYDNASVVLSGDNTLENCIVVDFAQGVNIRDITIQGFTGEAVKIINSAKVDMNRCVMRDNYIGLSISNQASTYTLNSCVFLHNKIGLKVFNTANAELRDSSFEDNIVAISAHSLGRVKLKGAKVSCNELAFESSSQSLIDFTDSIVTENERVANIDLATLTSRNIAKSSLVSNNKGGFFAVKSSVIDLQNVDLVNNSLVDISVDTASTALLEDCSLRKSAHVFSLSARKGCKLYLIGTTRITSRVSKLYDPMQEDCFFG